MKPRPLTFLAANACLIRCFFFSFFLIASVSSARFLTVGGGKCALTNASSSSILAHKYTLARTQHYLTSEFTLEKFYIRNTGCGSLPLPPTRYCCFVSCDGPERGNSSPIHHRRNSQNTTTRMANPRMHPTTMPTIAPPLKFSFRLWSSMSARVMIGRLPAAGCLFALVG